jgi:hypothetical protein
MEPARNLDLILGGYDRVIDPLALTEGGSADLAANGHGS